MPHHTAPAIRACLGADYLAAQLIHQAARNVPEVMVAKRNRCAWKEERVGRPHAAPADGGRDGSADGVVMHG